VRSTQGRSVASTRYELTDACGARPAATSVENTQGKGFSSSESGFEPAGAGPPYSCLTNKVVERDCEGEPDCTTKTTGLDYDRYGNLTATTETGASAGSRKTTTDFRPNTDDYIVDRPARRQTFEFEPDAPADDEWRRRAATEYLYDANAAWDSPPGAKGELRGTRAFDDRRDRHIETSFDYDPDGNRTKTTSPTGVVEQTFYDPQRSLFPVKHCDPVGCSEQTWKLKYGAPETTTDLNGQITSYGYDAYGRQTKVTNPDGGTSSTAYRDEGGWQGPDSQRQRVRTDVSDGSKGDGVLWQEQLLDGLGRVYKTVREGDGSGAIVSETRFADASERPVVSVDPHVGCCGAWTEYRYDGAHPPTATILPDGATSETVYRAGATLTRDPRSRSCPSRTGNACSA
jgi:YD repeat-containing protein